MTSGPGETDQVPDRDSGPQSRRERRAQEAQDATPTAATTRLPSGAGQSTAATTRLPGAGGTAGSGDPTAQFTTTQSDTTQSDTTQFVASAPSFVHERSIRPLPIALAVVAVVLATVGGLVIAGLAGKSAPPPVSAPTSPSPTPVVAAPPSTPAPVATPVVQPPRREAGDNECVDSTGEGGSVDIDSVSLKLENGDLVADYSLTSALPSGAASLGIFAESRDGKRSYQLAANWKDGELDTFFVHDFVRNRDTKLDPRDISWDGSNVVAKFPDDIAKALGDGWRWYAFSTVDGTDVDACPGDPLSFETITFDPDGD